MGVEKRLPGCCGWECELLLTAKKLYEDSWSVLPKEEQREKTGWTIITDAGGQRLDIVPFTDSVSLHSASGGVSPVLHEHIIAKERGPTSMLVCEVACMHTV